MRKPFITLDLPKIQRQVRKAVKEAAQDMADDMQKAGARPPAPGEPIRTPGELAAVGRMIWGHGWKLAMSEAIGVRLRSVQRWHTGEHSIPDDLHISIADAALKRADYLTKCAISIKGLAKS